MRLRSFAATGSSGSQLGTRRALDGADAWSISRLWHHPTDDSDRLVHGAGRLALVPEPAHARNAWPRACRSRRREASPAVVSQPACFPLAQVRNTMDTTAL